MGWHSKVHWGMPNFVAIGQTVAEIIMAI